MYIKGDFSYSKTLRVMQARFLTVKEGRYKYGKEENYNEPCNIGVGL